jgi:hypothetical protein
LLPRSPAKFAVVKSLIDPDKKAPGFTWGSGSLAEGPVTRRWGVGGGDVAAASSLVTLLVQAIVLYCTFVETPYLGGEQLNTFV